MTKLAEIVEQFYSGDWGTDKTGLNNSLTVKCVRAADFDNVSTENIDNVPTRFVSNSTNSILPVDSIIIEKSGGSPTQSTGRTVYISDSIKKQYNNIICSNFCTAFTIKKGWDPYFIYEYLQLVYDNGIFFNFESKTSGIKNLLLEEAFKSIPIPKIDFKDQIKIAEILGKIRNKSVNNYNIINLLEKIENEYYEEWFLRYNFKDCNDKNYKDNSGIFVYNENLKREIPTNWDVKKISSIFETKLGGTPDTKNEKYWNGDISWLSSGELDNKIITSSLKYITQEGMNNSSTSFAKEEDILISLVRYIRVSILGIGACFNQSIVAIPTNDIYRTEYIYPLIKKMIPKFMSLRTGNQQPHINKDVIDNTYVLCPPKDILMKYYSLVSDFYNIHINLYKELDVLENLKKYLLPILMNENLKIDD